MRHHNKAHRTVALVDLAQLKKNAGFLATQACRQYAQWAGLVPMVKCEAYGHGLVPVSQALAGEGGVAAFGVATLDEAMTLRHHGIKKPIWVFSDGLPLNEEMMEFFVALRLTPIIHSLEDLKAAIRFLKRRSFDFQLKVNTGLNRLGLSLSDLPEARRLLKRHQLIPQGLCSHLAISEDPKESLTRAQVKAFKGAVAAFSDFQISYIHCANTNGTLLEKELGLGSLCNTSRPGLGLYGYASQDNSLSIKLKPVLTWKARVLLSRVLKSGDRVGYGGTCKASRPTPQAVLGVGYGDGFRRCLSNESIYIAGSSRSLLKKRVMGRVSMDMISLDLKAKPGDWVTLLGQTQEQGEFMAKMAGTIVYEILTGISNRVPRVYEE